MHVLVLGSAAGGGFPQWNSNAEACRRARSGDPAAPARTQAGVAFSVDGEHWRLINAAPDLRAQILANPQLHAREGLRSSPIASVTLTGGDIDVIAGLLTLRERTAFTVYATPAILKILDDNPVFEVLARDVVARVPVGLDELVAFDDGAEMRLFPLPGKTPLYLEGDAPPAIETGETTTAAEVTHAGRRMLYIPGCARMTPDLARRIDGADLVFFDGTLWRDDEMITRGLGAKTGARMGHMSVTGPEGTLAAFSSLSVKRKIFIHINNSNPLLLADSAETAEARAAGWEVAYDGMEITL